ncbi:MAG: GIY-YIG nuclease family protein [Bacteroidales bacterium]
MKFRKTIKLYLIDGSTNGRLTCELSNWIGKAYKIPRSLIKECTDRPELCTTGVYMLLNKSADLSIKGQLYIGEAENIVKRLNQHVKQKDFWNEAIVFISKDENLNKAHIKYLENRLYEEAISAKRYELMNTQVPTQSSISESDKSEMEEFLENIKTLVNILGCNAFEAIRQTNITETDDDIFFINAVRGAKGRGKITTEGFVVFKDSQIANPVTPTFSSTLINFRNLLISKGIIVEKQNQLIMNEDYLFSSPSTAANIVMGRNANGLTEWKMKSGKTLKEYESGEK